MKAIADYLQSNGYNEALDSFKKENYGIYLLAIIVKSKRYGFIYWLGSGRTQRPTYRVSQKLAHIFLTVIVKKIRAYF